MEYIYQDFRKDIEHLRSVLILVESVKSFTGIINATPSGIINNSFWDSAQDVHKTAREANIGLAFTPGTIVLYLGGRFEFYVKTIFEELSMNVALKCKKFDYLPKEFKESLVVQTSEVIKSPAKYGHGDNGRNTFITNLSNNINGHDIVDINSKCLSITSENMRPQILSDLFARIGAKEIWTKLGQQAKMQSFFETSDSAKAQKDAVKFLNDFMDIRNKVAHPSSTFQWPNTKTVIGHIDYFEMLGHLILEICPVYETSLSRPAVEKLQQEDEKHKS